MVQEFKDFINKGNMVELAVAFVMGVAFTAVVTSLTDDVLMQIVAAIVGEPDFSALTFDLGDSVIRYGAFLTALINFLIISARVVLRRQGATTRCKADGGRGGGSVRDRPAGRDPRRAAVAEELTSS